jgi:transcription elongation factor S-II
VANEAKNGTTEPSSPSVKIQKNTMKETDQKVVLETKPKLETIATSNATSRSKVDTEVSRSSSSTTSSEAKQGKPLNLALIPKTKEATRDKIRELLAEAFSKVVDEAQGHDLARAKASDPIAVAVSVESVMFQTFGLSKGVNKMKYRSIMFNIRDANNQDLRRRVLLGDVSAGELMNMSAEDMASDQRKMQNDEIKKKALCECERGQTRQASTDQFKCGKCGQRKCTYYQMQTRSADEPMTTFVTCVNCNNRWKFC